LKKIGIIYHPKSTAARTLSEQLESVLPSSGISSWLCSSWDEDEIRAQVSGTDFVISVGGDGTILRVARVVAEWGIPIVGVNLGRLGFMAELQADEVVDKLPVLLAGESWVDERAMLQIDLLAAVGETEATGRSPGQSFCALNDVVVGRGAISRVIYVKASVDGEYLTTYKADGVLVGTATGSTGYSLAAGGPILYPQATGMVLGSIAPHLSMVYSLVVSPTAIVELEVHTDHQAICSIDGQVEFPLLDNDRVRVKISPHRTCLLRIHPPAHFYGVLEQRLRGMN